MTSLPRMILDALTALDGHATLWELVRCTVVPVAVITEHVDALAVQGRVERQGELVRLVTPPMASVDQVIEMYSKRSK